MTTEARSFGRVERELTDAERMLLRRRLLVVTKRRNRGLARALFASLIVCGALCAMTLLVSNAPQPIVAGFWGIMTIVFGAWSSAGVYRDLRGIERSIESALAIGKADGVRVRSDAVVSFEEIEDEGACFAFRVGETSVLFVVGQEFADLSAFPNSDFSITTIRSSEGRAVEIRVARHGEPLAPVRTVARDRKVRLAIPENLTVVETSLDDLERVLEKRTAGPGDIATSA